METKTFSATITNDADSYLKSSAHSSFPPQDYLDVMRLVRGKTITVEGENLHNLRFKVSEDLLDECFHEQESSPWFVTEERLVKLKDKYCNPEKPLSLAVRTILLKEDMEYFKKELNIQ